MTNAYALDHGEGSVLVVKARHRIAVRVRVFQRVKVTLRTQSILVEPAKTSGSTSRSVASGQVYSHVHCKMSLVSYPVDNKVIFQAVFMCPRGLTW